MFAAIDRKKRELREKGVDLIDLGIGDPDIPTAPHIVEALKVAAGRPENHRYPAYEGMLSFRAAAASWFKKRFGVDLDPKTEVLSLIGSKEGIGHMVLAFCNPGDVVLATEPGYPVYKIGTIFSGGRMYELPILEENSFLPDLSHIPAGVLRKAKLLFINYPNNPTGAVAPIEFFEEAVAFSRKHRIILCHDAAYTEVVFDGYRSPSALQVPGAKDVTIEFHSLSKTYCMTGWRIGFAVGHPDLVAGLGAIKTNLDSGVFQAVQEAGIAALTGDQSHTAKNNERVGRRRDLLVQALRSAGWRIDPPRATYYLWVRVPGRMSSADCVDRLMSEAGVVCTPGNGFGPSGEGFVRFSLTAPDDRIAEAARRLSKIRIAGPAK
ncbi:MAG: LL-diaminopimelate aminotransferase [Candidatus Lindowbacteria bacterium RIFCSPLOWO2_12_FULL_62_27]|nr:MAG: LL-diaminopimelate aminotransferase [Candidatus Lindowbacteria bacterium RIFCSPLOWO2_12_FULL_62_27]OGH63975.1 MAG: LL-diaminopimelate aminotransferase [Candidatus Lindowbacteria bacterium RIFCSPLOWO2_02_FULL_62_12]